MNAYASGCGKCVSAVCVCVCVHIARSCPAELPSLPQGYCLRAWSLALLPTTTRCVKATTPRSGRGTQKCCPFAFLRGDCPDPQAPPVPPRIGTEAIRAQLHPGPQCAHLSNGWRDGDHRLGCWRRQESVHTPQGLPWWLSGKEPTCQCRRPGFNPWAWKIPWRREWQPAPVFLPGKSHGRKSLAGCSPRGHKRVGHHLGTTPKLSLESLAH